MQIFEKYKTDYYRACDLFRKERDSFFAALSEIPYLHVFPSQANYFLCEVIEKFTSHELAIKLLKSNILIKDCSTKKAFNGRSFIRLAVRDRNDNDYLVHVLKSF